jgi:hypothetical protein
MGNNSAFTNFERLSMELYDKGLLNKEILSCIMEQYRDVDIDSGGSCDLISKDGLNIAGVVFKIFDIKVPEKPNIPTNWKDQTEEQRKIWDNYCSVMYDLFNKVTNKFGWC